MNSPYSIKNVLDNLPKKLKTFRRNKNLTVEEVGVLLNKTKSAVSMWETGKTVPDISTLLELCNLYGISDFNQFLDVDNNSENFDLNKREKRLLINYRTASKSMQNAIFNILSEYVNKDSKEE